MRKMIFYAVCIALMLGVWWLIKFMVVGISADFGIGFVAGIALMAVLYYAAERLGVRETHY